MAGRKIVLTDIAAKVCSYATRNVKVTLLRVYVILMQSSLLQIERCLQMRFLETGFVRNEARPTRLHTASVGAAIESFVQCFFVILCLFPSFQLLCEDWEGRYWNWTLCWWRLLFSCYKTKDIMENVLSSVVIYAFDFQWFDHYLFWLNSKTILCP